MEEEVNNRDFSIMENGGENFGCEENDCIKDKNSFCDIENGYFLFKGKLESFEEIQVLDYNYVENFDCLKFNCEILFKIFKISDILLFKKLIKFKRFKFRKKIEDKVIKEKKLLRRKSVVSKFVELVFEDQYQVKNVFDYFEVVVFKNFFECICGVLVEVRGISNFRKKKYRVQCVMCGFY